MRKIVLLNLILILGSSTALAKKPKETKPITTSSQNNQTAPQPTPKNDSPISTAEASAILQVAGGFFQILTAPNDPTHLATGIGAMASGMANLFYQLMKSKGFQPELSDNELQSLAEEMADMINQEVEMEMVRRSKDTQS
jgi:hypothetical protein